MTVDKVLYRFEADGLGIYAAVERDCPRNDNRRQSKPDGAWLPRIGPNFPGAISFFTETGLTKYVGSRLFHWHASVIQSRVEVHEVEIAGNALHMDRYQVIASLSDVKSRRKYQPNFYESIEPRRGVIFWDFDGTLAHSTPMWGRAAREALSELVPGHRFDLELLKNLFNEAFPWHRPESEHVKHSSPEKWWLSIEATFLKCFLDIGASEEIAQQAAKRIKETVLDTQSYRVIDGAVSTLAALRSAGWRHAIISNHVPELDKIVEDLGLRMFFEQVISSANVGHEKPSRKIFEHAIELLNCRDEPMWMIGDNPKADIEGARQFGIPSILVKNPARRPESKGFTLAEVYDQITNPGTSF